jgi:hypothetical protein
LYNGSLVKRSRVRIHGKHRVTFAQTIHTSEDDDLIFW